MNKIKYTLFLGFCLLAFLANAGTPTWQVKASNFSSSMTITGKINISGRFSNNENDLIAAFVGDECRGVVQNLWDNEFEAFYTYLMVHSNTAGEQISFKIYDATKDEIIDVKDTQDFVSNGIIGSDINPYFFYAANLTIWNGAIDADWSNVGNWSNGIPTLGINVYLGSNVNSIIDESAKCRNLIMEAGATLTINNRLESEGSVVLYSDALKSASLIVNGDFFHSSQKNSQSDLQKEIIYNRFVTGNKWHLIGSPLLNQSVADLLTNTSNEIENDGNGSFSMKYYQENLDNWSENYMQSDLSNLNLGEAYVIKRNLDGVIAFEGNLNKQTLNLSLKRESYGWNLISNPFTSAVAANILADVDNNLLSLNYDALDENYTALYVWDENPLETKNTNNYKVINQAGGNLNQYYLQVGQGFFVKSTTGGSDFTLTNAMQSHQPSIHIKSSEAYSGYVLTAETNLAKASTEILYLPNMSKGIDKGYDAGFINSYPDFALYSRLVEDNGVDFGIQCLPTDYDNLIIPIGLDAAANEEVLFSIEAKNLSEQYAVILEDRLLNTFTNLSEGDYRIQLNEATSGIGRFYIKTVAQGALGLDNLMDKDTFQIFERAQEQHIIIRGEFKINTRARIYSLSGKLIKDQVLNNQYENTLDFDAEQGVYLVQISNTKGVYTEKISWIK